MLQVLCPNCKNYMLCQPRGSVVNKSKRCVYCGKTFTIYGENSNRIIKIV